MSSFTPTPNIRVRRGPLDAVVGGINNGSLTHLNSVVNQNYLFQKPVIRESWLLWHTVHFQRARSRLFVRSDRQSRDNPLSWRLRTHHLGSSTAIQTLSIIIPVAISNTSSMHNSTDDHRDVDDEVARLIVSYYLDPPTHQSMHSHAKWCGDLYGKLDVPHVEINCGEGGRGGPALSVQAKIGRPTQLKQEDQTNKGQIK